MKNAGRCFAIACIVLSSSLAAQTPVAVGVRVRVRLREAERQRETHYRRELVLRGEVIAFGGDTLYIRPTPRTGVLPVPMSSVIALQRSRGVESRWSAGLGGAVAGALLGLLYVEGSYRRSSPFYSPVGHSRGEANRVGAAVGASLFAAMGIAFPVEGWRRVDLGR